MIETYTVSDPLFNLLRMVDDFTVEEILFTINLYDGYIQEANTLEKYAEGWFPVCIQEFIRSDMREIIIEHYLNCPFVLDRKLAISILNKLEGMK